MLMTSQWILFGIQVVAVNEAYEGSLIMSSE